MVEGVCWWICVFYKYMYPGEIPVVTDDFRRGCWPLCLFAIALLRFCLLLGHRLLPCPWMSVIDGKYWRRRISGILDLRNFHGSCSWWGWWWCLCAQFCDWRWIGFPLGIIAQFSARSVLFGGNVNGWLAPYPKAHWKFHSTVIWRQWVPYLGHPLYGA